MPVSAIARANDAMTAEAKPLLAEQLLPVAPPSDPNRVLEQPLPLFLLGQPRELRAERVVRANELLLTVKDGRILLV